jgi:hypothetical protein
MASSADISRGQTGDNRVQETETPRSAYVRRHQAFALAPVDWGSTLTAMPRTRATHTASVRSNVFAKAKSHAVFNATITSRVPLFSLSLPICEGAS